MVIFMKTFFENILDFITNKLGENFYLYIIGVIIVIFGVMMLISSSYKNKKKIIEQEIDLNHNTRHYKLDLENNKIYSFVESDMSNSKSITIEEFYNQFSKADVSSIQTWIHECVSKKRYRKYMTFYSYNDYHKQYTFNLLEIKKINDNLTKIYFDLVYIPTYNKKKSQIPFIKEEYQLEKLFHHQKSKSVILTGLISFHLIDEAQNIDTYQLKKTTLFQIINDLLKLCDKKHLLQITPDGNISFCIFDYDNKKDTFLTDVKKQLSMFYELNNMRYETFNIVYTTSKKENLHHKFNLIKLDELSKSLILNKIYDQKIVQLKDAQFIKNKAYLDKNDAIKTILKKNLLDINFCPIINIKNCHIVTYRLKILPNNDEISSYADFIENLTNPKDIINFLKYMIKICKENLQTNEVLERRKIEKCVLLDINSKMLYEIKNVINDIMECSEVTFIFNLNSKNFYEHADRYPEIYDYLEELKNQNVNNVKLALHLNNIIHIDERLYEYMNLISISGDLFNLTRKDYRQTSLFNNTITNLRKFAPKTPLYFSGVDDWVTYETLLSYNMKYCSGNIFEIENDVNAIVNKRIQSKIKSIYKKHFLPLDKQ